MLTLWIRWVIPESPLWEQVNDRRRAAKERQRSGAAETAQDTALTRFTLHELFADPVTRQRAIVTFLMATASAVGFWGISSWIPPYIGSIAAKSGLAAPQWASYTGMAYNAGSIIGYVGFGFLADAFGRKPITFLFFALSLVLTPACFSSPASHLLLILAGVLGCFASGQFTWMSAGCGAFPDQDARDRSGFRLQRSALPGGDPAPSSRGALIVKFGGYENACMIVATIYVLALVAIRSCPRPREEPLPE